MKSFELRVIKRMLGNLPTFETVNKFFPMCSGVGQVFRLIGIRAGLGVFFLRGMGGFLLKGGCPVLA